MSIYTHGDEIDPRRDGCDSCTDLRAELERQSALLHDSRAEIDRLTAENERLLEVLRNLLERVDRNGGLGEYKGGKAFAVSDARAALNQEEKP